MAAYETGYDDERFQYPVGQSFHCSICTNVFKEPVTCGQNEHLFCRSCISEHLKNHQSCPHCMEVLTIDTLGQAPRTVTNLLAELKIRCEFFNRGCGKFIELGNLERHNRECGFAPAVCSNEGCALEVNKQDLLHHETAVCEQRRVKCHSCNEIRQEMDIVKVNLAAMNIKLEAIDENLKKNEKKLERIEMNGKAVKENVVSKVELVQQQLNKQEVTTCQVQGDIVDIKNILSAIANQLQKKADETSRENQEQKQIEEIPVTIGAISETTVPIITDFSEPLPMHRKPLIAAVQPTPEFSEPLPRKPLIADVEPTPEFSELLLMPHKPLKAAVQPRPEFSEPFPMHRKPLKAAVQPRPEFSEPSTLSIKKDRRRLKR